MISPRLDVKIRKKWPDWTMENKTDDDTGRILYLVSRFLIRHRFRIRSFSQNIKARLTSYFIIFLIFLITIYRLRFHSFSFSFSRTSFCSFELDRFSSDHPFSTLYSLIRKGNFNNKLILYLQVMLVCGKINSNTVDHSYIAKY